VFFFAKEPVDQALPLKAFLRVFFYLNFVIYVL